MPDLTLLMKPLTAEGEPGLSTLDDRFQEIAGLAQDGNFSEAASRTQAIVQEGIYDIRLLGYFLYGVFSEKGLPALGDIFECLRLVCADNWGAFGPTKKKDKQAEAALLWLFSTVLKQLKHEQEKTTPLYNEWMQKVSSEMAEAAIEKLDGFRRAMGPVMEAPKVLALLPNITTWLKDFQRTVYQASAPAPAAAEAPKEAPKEEAKESKGGGAGQGGGAPMPAGGMGSVTVTFAAGSFLLQQLMDKIDAFDQLGKKKQLEKAAIVAHDINTIVESFDPRLYLPQVFAKYYQRMTSVVEELEPLLDNRDSLKWRMLEQLYRCDLKAFTEGQ